MAEPTSQLSLAVNDRVVYPNQGVCRVAGIDTKEIAGQKLVFVTLKREIDSAIVMVPQTKLQSIGVRKVASPEDVQQVWDFLKSDSDKADLDWKQRARTNVERMSLGGIVGLAEVVKGLQVLSELRPLPTKERELYDNARYLLVTELSASTSMAECDAEDAIDLALSPVGRDRPKRTAEEFKRPGEEDDLDLGEDILGLGGDLELPPEEEPPPEDEESSEEEGSGDDDEDKPKKPAASGAKKPARVSLSDDEPTEAFGAALVPDGEVPAKRKRGRPPKPKPAVDPNVPPPPPKKRGRPPKPRPLVDPNAPPPVPKKRGRPPKKK